MNDKEKKAFVARMKKGRAAAKGKSKSKGGGKSATKQKLSMDKIYHLTYKGEKIPYEISGNYKVIVLKKDYPNQVNKILKRKYPKITSVEHQTHYTTFK